jgi:hypothetical protein
VPLITVQTGPKNAYTNPETGIRYYRWQGQDFPSVTSIRNLAGMPIMLAQWRTNQVIERAMTEYQTLGRMLGETDPKTVAAWLRKAQDAKRDAAADLGKRVHDAAANGVSPANAPSDVAPFLLQYNDWLASTGLVIELVERQVWSPSVGYAGTFDMIARFPKKGECWLIDLKTGKGTYAEHALQTEAYARADFVGEDDIEDVAATAILRSIPKTNRAVLHLRPDGWSFKTLPGTDRTWVAFRALLNFAEWVDDNPTIDNLIGAVKEGHA